MKKGLLYSLLAILFFSSCKKEHSATTDPAQKKYRVSFDASGFTSQVTGSVTDKKQVSSVKTNAIGTGVDIDNFEYLVYSNTGALIHRVLQPVGTPGLGTVVDSLPAGTYNVYFIAWQSASTTVNISSQVIINTTVPWGDTFFKKLTLTVSGENVDQAVSLERIVGQLSVKLLDTLPSNASTLSISTNELITDYFFTPGSQITTATFKHLDTIKKSIGYSYTTYYMDSRPFTVTIACYDASNKLLAQSIVGNVSVTANRQTILTGYLFGSSTGVTPVLNQGWNPGPVNGQF